MFKEFLNNLMEKTSDSVIGETVKTFINYYRDNKILTQGVMLICAIIDFAIVGYIAGHYALTQGLISNFQTILIPFYAIRYGIIPTLIVFILLLLLTFRLISILGSGFTRDRERKYNVAKEGSQGTATFMQEHEKDLTFVSGTIEEVEGDILGEDKKDIGQLMAILEQYGINRNMLVVGSPGSGKSRCLVINMILQIIRRGESAVVTDPKGELFSYTSEVAKQYGYKVRLVSFNPQSMEHSDSVNYMRFIEKDSLKAQSLAYTILMNTSGNTSGKREFWDDSMMNLLTALLLYVDLSEDIDEDDKNLPYIYSLVTGNSVSSLATLFVDLPESHPAKAPFNTFMNGDNVVKGNTLTSLAIRLQCFNAETVKRVTSTDEVSFTQLGEEKCIYYVGSSDQDSSMDFMVALFFTVLFQKLVALADSQPEQVLKVKVNMVLDEFKNIGIIPDFKKKLSTVRSRGINTTIIIQGISQIQEMYPNNAWYEIVNDCSIHVLLQTNDELTAEFFSNRSGEQTTLTKNKRYSESSFDLIKIHPTYTVTESESQRTLLTKHEILTMDINDILVVVSTRNVIKLKKYDFSKNPMASEIKRISASQHMPKWKLMEMGILEYDDDYDSYNTNLANPSDYAPVISIREKPHGIFYKDKKNRFEEKREVGTSVNQKIITATSLNKTFDVSIDEQERIEEELQKENLRNEEREIVIATPTTTTIPPKQKINNIPVQKKKTKQFNGSFSSVDTQPQPTSDNKGEKNNEKPKKLGKSKNW